MTLVKTMAIPQSLLNEKARLDFADTSGMDEATLAQHIIDVELNNSELAKYGDIQMTPEEIAARQLEESIYQAELMKTQWISNRQNAYESKGWHSPYDLIDDILKRGLEAVKSDREKIKADNPKGE